MGVKKNSTPIEIGYKRFDGAGITIEYVKKYLVSVGKLLS
jgi:hypothetical protein